MVDLSFRLGDHGRYPAQTKMQKPNYPTVLLATLGFAFLVGIAALALLAPESESQIAEPLAGGQWEINRGAILSWEADTENQIFRARIHNNTNEPLVVRMKPDNLEAVISITTENGTEPIEFAQQDYYKLLLVGFWIPPELEIESKSAHDWNIPFTELKHMEYASQLTFGDAAKSGAVKIVSVHGLNHRYDEQGRFDGFK